MSKAEELANELNDELKKRVSHVVFLPASLAAASETELRRLAQVEAEHAALLKAIMDAEPVGWLVLSSNNDGSTSIEYAAEWKEAAHEHIGDAIAEYGNTEAATWIVRPAYTLNGIKKP